MTATQAPPTVPSHWVTPAVEPSPPAPGRWIGGLIGAGLSLLVAVIGGLGLRETDFGFAIQSTTQLGLFGIPVGAVLGTLFWPIGRRVRGFGVLGVGLAIGVLALPLGDLIIVTTLAASALSERTVDLAAALVSALSMSIIGLVFSVVAAPITIPVGIAWAVIVRLLPERLVSSVAGVTGRRAAS
jgi:hypothetical protein